MPKTCSAFGCSNHGWSNKKISFHRIPTRKGLRRSLWLQALGRLNTDGTGWRPETKWSYVCGQHFITGKPHSEPDHPDFAPSIFVYSSTPRTKGVKDLDRFNESLKRAAKPELQPDKSTASTSKKAHFELPSPSAPASLQDGTSEEIASPGAPTNETLLSPGQSTTETVGDPDTVTQATLTADIDALYSETDNLRKELSHSQNSKSCDCSTELIKDDDKKCMYYTGLSWAAFVTLVDLCESKLKMSAGLSPKEQIFVTLVRLRQNIKAECLADQLGISVSSASSVFWTVLNVFYETIGSLVFWPHRKVVHQTIPEFFRTDFPRMTSVIDCTEIFIERPVNQSARAEVYSSYTKHSTVKLLMACNPYGDIAYISPAWGGGASDIDIVRKSGFISPKYHSPGDQILADKGFALKEEFALICGAELVLPSFAKGKPPVTEKERKKSAARVEIKRVIGLLKSRYTILQDVVPVNLMKPKGDKRNRNRVTGTDVIVRVCAALINMNTFGQDE